MFGVVGPKTREEKEPRQPGESWPMAVHLQEGLPSPGGSAEDSRGSVDLAMGVFIKRGSRGAAWVQEGAGAAKEATYVD